MQIVEAKVTRRRRGLPTVMQLTMVTDDGQVRVLDYILRPDGMGRPRRKGANKRDNDENGREIPTEGHGTGETQLRERPCDSAQDDAGGAGVDGDDQAIPGAEVSTGEQRKEAASTMNLEQMITDVLR